MVKVKVFLSRSNFKVTRSILFLFFGGGGCFNNHGDLHELQIRYFVDEWCKIEADGNVKVAMEIY